MSSLTIRLISLVMMLSGLLLIGQAAQAGEIFEAVKERGFVRCSLDDTPGFGAVGNDGERHGLDVDFCRAVAAAVFDDPNAVELLRISTKNKFDALARGEIDIVLGMTTWTLQRDTARQGNFVGVIYYDGQGFLAWKSEGLVDLASAKGATVCVQSETTSAANLQDLIKSQGLDLTVKNYTSSDERRDAFMRQDCQLTTGDLSGLAAFRAVSAPVPESLMILPDVISREPLAPMVSEKDTQWFDIVKWTLQALILAEEKGLSQAILKATGPEGLKASHDAEFRRFIGIQGDLGEHLGLEPDWALQIVKHLGHYGDVFQRNLGKKSPLGLERGQNALWREGGLLYPHAFR